MASHLDLEEQEQLDQFKHFWKRYGSAITWVVILVLLGASGWNGYQYWQRTQANKAAMLYDEVEKAAQAKDSAKIKRVLEDMRAQFGSTEYAQQGVLLGAKTLYEQGDVEGARAALQWMADQGKDAGLQAIARLRLAGLQIDAKEFDAALKTLSASFPPEFSGLVADRKGDVYTLQGNAAQALVEYRKAFKELDLRSEYRALVQAKLNALGVDPTQENKNSAGATPRSGS